MRGCCPYSGVAGMPIVYHRGKGFSSRRTADGRFADFLFACFLLTLLPNDVMMTRLIRRHSMSRTSWGRRYELAGRHRQWQADGLWRSDRHHLVDTAVLLPGLCRVGDCAQRATYTRSIYRYADGVGDARAGRHIALGRHTGANAHRLVACDLYQDAGGQQNADGYRDAHQHAHADHNRDTCHAECDGHPCDGDSYARHANRYGDSHN